MTGLGIISFTFFPFAVPALVFVVAPLALLGVIGLLLAAPFILPLWLVRRVRQGRAAHTQALHGFDPRRPLSEV